jgi:hypothetical protein
VSSWFKSDQSRHFQRPTTPKLSGESAVSIPCHINDNHWVMVTRRENLGQVIFLYADDLNNIVTENNVRHTLSSADPIFYPPSSTWIKCNNYTYTPHSNECGIRSLLAASVQALHPAPHENILIPYMHQNLAQIGRTWIATSLMNSHIDDAPLNWTIYQLNTLPSLPPYQSLPASLISWESALVANTSNTTTNPSPIPSLTPELELSGKPIGEKFTLNPLALPFFPRPQE